MDCPKCKSKSHVKYGQVGGLQRFKCMNCGRQYRVEEHGKPMALKKLALKMYLEGMGFRAIGRILEVSQVSIMFWIRKFGEIASQTVELQTPAPIIEIDELHSYIGVKKTTSGSGLRSTASKKRTSTSKLAAGALRQGKNCTKK